MWALILVAALGYFVDVYDLILFSIVRVKSLQDIGLSGNDLMDKGILILNLQMIGMLIGGILWGILGDLVSIYQICFFGKGIKAPEWSEAIDAPQGKKSFKLKLNFVRGVGGKKVSAAFSESLSKTPTENKLEGLERQKFIAWSSNLKIEKESVMELTFNETKPLSVSFFQEPKNNIDVTTFTSDHKGMARAVAGIWLGAKPLNEDLKTELFKEPVK